MIERVRRKGREEGEEKRKVRGRLCSQGGLDRCHQQVSSDNEDKESAQSGEIIGMRMVEGRKGKGEGERASDVLSSEGIERGGNKK